MNRTYKICVELTLCIGLGVTIFFYYSRNQSGLGLESQKSRSVVYDISLRDELEDLAKLRSAISVYFLSNHTCSFGRTSIFFIDLKSLCLYLVESNLCIGENPSYWLQPLGLYISECSHVFLKLLAIWPN